MTSTFFYIFFKLLFLSTSVRSYPSSRQPRDSIVLDYSNYNAFQPQGAGSYSFGYEIEDPEYNNVQYRDEERQPNGTVTGSYGWVKPDGNIIMIKYIADEKGYRASVANSPGQLKFYGEPIPTNFKKSSIILNALNNHKIYKKQHVQEQRYRPIDVSYKTQFDLHKKISNVNDNFHYSNLIKDGSKKNGYHDDKGKTDFYYIEPQRILVYADDV